VGTNVLCTTLEELTDGQREQLAALLSRAFAEADAGDAGTFERRQRHPTLREMQGRPPFGAHGTHLIATGSGEFLAHVAFYERAGALQGSPVRLACIEDVATDPTARGRGLATRLLKLAADRAGKQGLELGILWTMQPAFYERLGWRTWQGELSGATRPPLALPLSAKLRRMGEALFASKLALQD